MVFASQMRFSRFIVGFGYKEQIQLLPILLLYFLICMTTPTQRRLLQDLNKLKKSDNDGIDAIPDEDSLYLWEAVIYGPIDTIWEGGTFRLSIQFTQDYPNKPPLIIFTTKTFHPNIYKDGKICLDLLQTKWSHMYDLSSLLTSIRSLLSDPNPQSPANQQAAKLFTTNREEYERRVKEIVEMSWKTHHQL